MLHFSHRSLILLSGLVWFFIGGWLLYKGLNFLVQALAMAGGRPWLDGLHPFVGSLDTAVVFVVMFALLIGYFKGTRVLGKAAEKGVRHIAGHADPMPLHKVYRPGYYAILAVMMMLGLLMNWISVPADIRGFVDVAIGSALINGAMVYFRKAAICGTGSLC